MNSTVMPNTPEQPTVVAPRRATTAGWRRFLNLGWRRFLNRCREATRGTVKPSDKSLASVLQSETSWAFDPQVQEPGLPGTIAGPPDALFASRRRSGFSLIELMVVVAIMGVLAAAAVPSFQRSIEQSRADVAVVNLRTFWTAQRVYWLKTRTFADDWDKLWDMKLIDEPKTREDDDPPHAKHYTTYYTYEISDVTDTAFRITAHRVDNSSWRGTFEIDDTGFVQGEIESGSRLIKPGFQD